ncbi:uncharacterized protein MYCFIDRAFT_85108 [Pseudocercospora fijiensis CIRAD86]|uniref:Uncharacterized protein n=1 Tax=Pseudocercospora fijiensis (strain CIRAD86) TaxID=383855 RepID=M2YI64_PSEFD|nr:uncharacterized protein MYCFIDRAFT_85108 [Pseudocercospora fijiensis CIRAD86]EME77460.1 hypothetical protein MYCFIDRAFT_85108 [Pseudocercospora fijiensis CIRAD86]
MPSRAAFSGRQRRGAYTLLANDEDVASYKSSTRHWCIYTIVVVLITHAVSAPLLYFYARRMTLQQNSLDFPGIDRAYPGLDRSLSIIRFSDFRGPWRSRWSAPPSKKVDGAWDELGVNDHGFIIPEATGREVFNLDRRQHLYLPKGYFVDKNQEGFPVILQATHDLHCLNELRKSLYFNYDYYRQFHNDTLVSPSFRIDHTNHCLDNLRERLMCTADVGVNPSVWIRKDDNALQFGREHKCHNYESVMQWLDSFGIGPGRTLYQVGGEEHIDAPPDAILHDPKYFGQE